MERVSVTFARNAGIVFLVLAGTLSLPLLAQTVTIPDEYASHIRQRDTQLAPEGALFGDRTSLNDGGLEIVQTESSIGMKL